MANEVAIIEQWIYARGIGDTGAGGLATLLNNRWYPYLGPQKAAYPLGLYSLQTGSDVQGLGTNRVMTRPLYLLKIISRGYPSDAAVSAASRLDELFTVAAVTYQGYVFTGRRDQAISFQETDEANTVYRHVGGLYRIECYPSG